MGYCRGVPHAKRAKLDRLAERMRKRNLTTGGGCRSVAKAIDQRAAGVKS
jgi:hypothetical protein